VASEAVGEAPAPSSSAAWGGGRRGAALHPKVLLFGIHLQHASSSWSAPHWAAWMATVFLAIAYGFTRIVVTSILTAHCCTSSGGGVIGLVFIIIKLMQVCVINKKGSSCSYCP
jgi:hypothetical protein